ncbi:MAG: DUF4058 family protein [Gemmataceae bacterium]|nr:DUF4058 family protein [Gemmataceae bacterium]
MPSPFPGMNPYLERRPIWREFHQNFLTAARAALVTQVRPRYVVRLEPTLYIREPADDGRREIGESDLGLVPGRGAAGAAAAVLEAPAYGTLPAGVDTEEVFRIEIRDRDGNAVVTVVEVLSPTNKYAGRHREQYLTKRQQVLHSDSHFVELDLLRGGPRMPLIDRPRGDYFAVVSRADDRPQVGIWAWGLRDPLEPVPVPLRDSNARLDLKAVLDRVYDEGGYEDFAYEGPPEPRLSPADAAWAAPLVPQPPARQEP